MNSELLTISPRFSTDKAPKNVVSVTVCAISGKLPNPNCKSVVTEYFPKDAVPKEKCDMHQELVICRYSGKLPTPYCPANHLSSSPITIIPKDSIYQKLTDEQLAAYIPGAFRTPVNLSSFDYNNPKQRDAFCPLHDLTWKQAEDMRAELTSKAKRLIQQINDNISMYDSKLSGEDITAIEAAINKLEDSLNKGIVGPPDEGQPYYTEIPLFKPEVVQKEMDNLKQTYDAIIDKVYDDE